MLKQHQTDGSHRLTSFLFFVEEPESCTVRASILKSETSREVKIMNMFGICLRSRKQRESLCAIAVIVSVFLFGQPAFNIVVDAQGRTRVVKKQTMTENQRIARVLSRLTFGARPGDFERVKAMGVKTFIAQQLDSDSFDDSVGY
jgi:hypothetical protein